MISSKRVSLVVATVFAASVVLVGCGAADEPDDTDVVATPDVVETPSEESEGNISGDADDREFNTESDFEYGESVYTPVSEIQEGQVFTYPVGTVLNFTGDGSKSWSLITAQTEVVAPFSAPVMGEPNAPMDPGVTLIAPGSAEVSLVDGSTGEMINFTVVVEG